MLAAIAGRPGSKPARCAGALEAEDAIFALPSLPFSVTFDAVQGGLPTARGHSWQPPGKQGPRLLYLTPLAAFRYLVESPL